MFQFSRLKNVAADIEPNAYAEDWNAEKNNLSLMRQQQVGYLMYSYIYWLNFNADTLTFKYIFLFEFFSSWNCYKVNSSKAIKWNMENDGNWTIFQKIKSFFCLWAVWLHFLGIEKYTRTTFRSTVIRHFHAERASVFFIDFWSLTKN